MSIIVNQRKKGPQYVQGVEPSNPKAGMVWHDTSDAGKGLKVRNKDNDGWDTLQFSGFGVYGYVMGGYYGSRLSTVDRIEFPFNSGTASVVGNLTRSVASGSGCNSSVYGYSCAGGNTVRLTATERIEFPFNSGTSTATGNLINSRQATASCNSSSHGYVFGGDKDPAPYLSVIERFTFPFDSGTASNVGTIYEVRYINGFNSSTHGYTMGGSTSGFSSTILRITFPHDSGAASAVGTLSFSRMVTCGCNSSTHGYGMGAGSTAPDTYFSTISRVTFPHDSGSASDVGNLSQTKYLQQGLNSSIYGYSECGFLPAGSPYLSTVERITFPHDSGAASVVGNLSSTMCYPNTCDETDFIGMFV